MKSDKPDSEKSEHEIQNEIRTAVSPYVKIFRINVGVFRTDDNRTVSTGVPKGFSDLFGVRISDGKAVFIEIKDHKGRLRPEQKNFLAQMKSCGAIAGVARSVSDALELIK